MRHVTISRNDDLYEAFPDLCLLPSGKLLCIYRESDWHVASTSRTMLTESDDHGRTWTNHRPFDVTRTFAEHRSVWNAPRIAMLPDGRVVANFDAAGCSSTTVRSSAPTTIVTMRRSRTSAAAGSARRTFRRQDSAGAPLYE